MNQRTKKSIVKSNKCEWNTKQFHISFRWDFSVSFVSAFFWLCYDWIAAFGQYSFGFCIFQHNNNNCGSTTQSIRVFYQRRMFWCQKKKFNVSVLKIIEMKDFCFSIRFFVLSFSCFSGSLGVLFYHSLHACV